MKKKKIPLIVYLFSILVTAAVFGGGGYLIATQQPEPTSQATTEVTGLNKIQALYEAINQNYYKKVDQTKLIDGALKGMTDALDDPYTTYLDTTGAKELNQSLADSIEGIGATLSLVDDLPQIVQAPIKDTPAQKAGLRAKDQILQVDGKETKGEELDQVVAKIRGKKGTKVKLLIKRDATEFEVTLTRDKIPLETVHNELDAKDASIGVIQITTFGEGTAKELREAIISLRKKGAKSFLIDLRQNPGGLLDQVQIMASMFLEDGKTIVEFSDDKNTITKTVAGKELDDGFKVKEPTAVLVDGGSASASEIFAAALKESAKIPVIGTQTFGKGTVQSIADLGDNSELKLTVMKWLTPNGTWINEKGVTPTIEADYPSYAYLAPLPRNKTLKIGQSSPEVDRLNQFLKGLGFSTAGDDYTEATKAAVEKIQTDAKLSVTGQVDDKTADAIEAKVLAEVKSHDNAYEAGIKELRK